MPEKNTYTKDELEEFRKMNLYVKKELSKIKSPILIIHSQNDQVSIQDNVEIITKSIQSKDKNILNVENAHHNMFDNNPDLELIFSSSIIKIFSIDTPIVIVFLKC